MELSRFVAWLARTPTRSVPTLRADGPAFLLLVVLLVSAAVPASAHAQWVKGIVLDEFSHGPVKGADVALVADGKKVVARAMTRDDGRFTMTIPRLGGYHLEVSGLGYASFTTKVFFVDAGQQVSAQVNLAPEAIKLEGLEVIAKAVERKLRLAGFYKREEKKVGYFITPQEIQEKQVNRLTDALYGIPGMTVRRVPIAGGNDGWDIVTNSGETKYFVGGRCYPSIAIDGTIVRHGGRATLGASAHDVEIGDWYQLVDPHDVVAIEVYPTGAGAPVQMLGQESPCGAVLIWTKDR